jgi:type 1 fimbriae regulatory protein FimE
LSAPAVGSPQARDFRLLAKTAAGYKLANDGHDTRAIQAYLGHRNIQNTTRYTALAPQRFKEFFRD